MSRRLLVWMCVAAALLLPRIAAAKVVRYAVVVGNDEGAADERSLRYAQSDAQKVADVLVSLGEFPEENVVVLLGDTADDVERVLITINDRIRVEQRQGDEVMLVVYYSGHADADALHLGTTRLDTDRLRRLVRGSPASFRMLVLDACRSGALTRAKGGRRVAPFAVELDDHLAGEGVVFMTASAATEDAQESDELRGSFFTHYLLSALRGAADDDGDGWVSVAEAYDHAYASTIRASSRSLHGTQHPNFHFDLRGQGQVALTRVQGGRRGSLSFPKGRTYLVFTSDANGAVVGEVGVTDRRRTLTLEPGWYFVRGRAADHLLEGRVRVRTAEVSSVDDDDLARIEYARLVRKGGGSRGTSHGIVVGYQLRSPLWRDSSLCHGARVGYPIELAWLTVSPRVGFCRAGFAGDRVTTTADDLDVELQLTHVFDVPVVSIGLGVGGGASWLRQRFVTKGRAPTRNTLGGHADAILDLWWDLPRGFYVLTEGTAQLVAFASQSSDGKSSIRAVPTGRLFVGVGKRF